MVDNNNDIKKDEYYWFIRSPMNGYFIISYGKLRSMISNYYDRQEHRLGALCIDSVATKYIFEACGKAFYVTDPKLIFNNLEACKNYLLNSKISMQHICYDDAAVSQLCK